jgi:hypothetical protein
MDGAGINHCSYRDHIIGAAYIDADLKRSHITPPDGPRPYTVSHSIMSW